MNEQNLQQSKFHQIAIYILTLLIGLPGFAALMLILFWLPGSPISKNMYVIESAAGSKIMLTTAGDNAPRALFYDNNGNTPLTLQLTPTGVPMINIDSPNGTRAINISTALPGGKPQIMLFNPETGKPAWSVKIDNEGKPVITDHTLSDD